MNRIVRGEAAACAAWKWGGVIIGTIFLLIIVYYMLGYI